MLHYFDRPHEGPAREPLADRSAWRGSRVRTESDWLHELRPDDVAELEAALAHAVSSGKPIGDLTASDFPLPRLAATIRDWRTEVNRGRGLLVVRGVPVQRWSRDDAERFFWCIGLHMGRPGTQNVHGDLLGHVTDTGDDASDPFVRLYRTASDIAYHCDAADVVGLL